MIATIIQKDSMRRAIKNPWMESLIVKIRPMFYIGGKGGRSRSIHEIAPTEAEQKAAYRFLNNEKTAESTLIHTVKETKPLLCTGKAHNSVDQFAGLVTASIKLKYYRGYRDDSRSNEI